MTSQRAMAKKGAKAARKRTKRQIVRELREYVESIELRHGVIRVGTDNPFDQTHALSLTEATELLRQHRAARDTNTDSMIAAWQALCR